MDYIFFSAITPILFLSVIISYDIACQWKLNLARRIDKLPEHLRVPLAFVVSSCHGSTGSPSALSEEDSKGGVTVLEGSKVLARGTRFCT